LPCMHTYPHAHAHTYAHMHAHHHTSTRAPCGQACMAACMHALPTYTRHMQACILTHIPMRTCTPVTHHIHIIRMYVYAPLV
jgi:hypothetical protein